MKLPIRIEFKFWEICIEDESIFKEIYMKDMQSGTLGHVILHFSGDDRDAIMLSKTNPKIGAEGQLELFSYLENAVRMYISKEITYE